MNLTPLTLDLNQFGLVIHSLRIQMTNGVHSTSTTSVLPIWIRRKKNLKPERSLYFQEAGRAGILAHCSTAHPAIIGKCLSLSISITT